MNILKNTLIASGVILGLALASCTSKKKEMQYNDLSDKATVEYIQGFHKEIHLANKLQAQQNAAIIDRNEE